VRWKERTAGSENGWDRERLVPMKTYAGVARTWSDSITSFLTRTQKHLGQGA
jgi:hypothetical protein